jgi:hypothetical protein
MKIGKKFAFHGAFGSKAAAVEKEREVGGFIRKMTIRGDTRYVVLTRKDNPSRDVDRGWGSGKAIGRGKGHTLDHFLFKG